MTDDCLKYQFTEATNPTTGKKEWVAEVMDEHDYVTGENPNQLVGQS